LLDELESGYPEHRITTGGNMSENLQRRLVKQLINAHAMEKQAIQLLDKGADIIGDEEVARIFRAHRLQTEEHERYIAERLKAYGKSPSKLKDVAMQAGALGVGMGAKALPDTPLRLATVAFAFENLEIASYDVLRRLADRAGDSETVAVSERILEQEEAAAELVGGISARALELTLGEPARSPLPGVTPLGKPSERAAQPYEHGGPQDYKDKPADASLGQPPHIDTPTEGEHLASPDAGHPAGEANPYGNQVPNPEHPEPIGPTTPDQDQA
jgi:ferritin-like metal-binding protein YciE